MYFREDQAAIHVSVTGVPLDNEPWSAVEGGDNEAQNVNIRPGGMAPRQELGGPPARTDITVHRHYSDVLHAQLVPLENVVGRAAMKVAVTPLDPNGLPAGNTVTYSGILKQVIRPNFDSEATAAAKLALVMAAHEPVVNSSN